MVRPETVVGTPETLTANLEVPPTWRSRSFDAAAEAVLVMFSTHPAKVTETSFQVWVKAAGARKVQARFTMQGMDMGFNLYTLRTDGDGIFRARVILPVCVTGRRDWIMAVEIDDAVLNVPFSSDL